MHAQFHQKLAQNTKSPHFFNQNHEPFEIAVVLQEAIDAAGYADVVKKSLFYDKRIDPYYLDSMVRDAAQGHYGAQLDHLDADILHAVLGLITESAELAELVLTSMLSGEPVDRQKMIDELGDVRWYYSILLSAIGSNDDEVTDKNIAKLRTRFPNKFSLYAATTRDTEAENQAMFPGMDQ